MITLWQIDEDLKSLCNAIASLFLIHVTIYDHLLNVVYSTDQQGHYVIGQKIRGYSASEAIGFDKVMINEQPGLNKQCLKCDLWQKCPEKADMNCSITIEGKSFGGIGLTAFDEKQRNFLLGHTAELTELLRSLSGFIAARIAQENLIYSNHQLYARSEEIFQRIKEAVIAVDNTGLVTMINMSAETLYGFSKKEVLGKPLELYLPNRPLVKLIKGIKLDDNERKKVNTISLDGQIIGACEIQDNLDGSILKNKMRIPLNYFSFEDIIGISTIMLSVKETASKISKSESSVLIRGESGTGKELFAQAIHTNSKRSKGPFRAINCAAIPENLLESELFGYEEGAFTGANRKGKPGKFELTDGGTLFLDEIGDIPLHLQAKMLRVLETRLIERVGGNDIIPINVRLITATNRNLEEMIANGTFREDLYYRINVIPLNIPPLRDREEDILVLAKRFITKYNELLGKKIIGLSKEVENLFEIYSWPGNVRELENCIEYAVNFESGSKITINNIPEKILGKNAAAGQGIRLTLKEIEDRYIKSVMAQFPEDKAQAAEILGIDVSTLYRKIKKS